MRLIAEFSSDKESSLLHRFLLEKGIKNLLEKASPTQYRVWVANEDDLEEAQRLTKEFNPTTYTPQIDSPESEPVQKTPSRKKTWLSALFLMICAAIFLIIQMQEIQFLNKKEVLLFQEGATSCERALLYDYPKSNELLERFIEQHHIETIQELHAKAQDPSLVAILNIPSWQGYLAKFSKKSEQKLATSPPFTKITEGQWWRLFTPSFLHRDFLHIVFNMIWLWVLGKVVEERLKPLRYLGLVLLLAAVSNTCQYLISGPLFLGYSGVVVGLATFIWMRQVVAPWETYPIKKGMLYFLFVYVIVMVAISMITLITEALTDFAIPGLMANTAHVAGGLAGLILARCSFFARRSS